MSFIVLKFMKTGMIHILATIIGKSGVSIIFGDDYRVLSHHIHNLVPQMSACYSHTMPEAIHSHLITI